ncbi:MAG: hypothetical protein HEQ25_13530, partial [Dolichospermum sp. DET73]|nr:hypothetical protein [Dolichospermum sp. DET73]
TLLHQPSLFILFFWLQYCLEQLVSDVSPEVKATLVKRLLGDGGLQVTFGQSHVNATNFYNIQSASTEQLSEIILAISDIIKKS